MSALEAAAARWRPVSASDREWILRELREDLFVEDNSNTPMTPAYEAVVALLEAASAEPTVDPVLCSVCAKPATDIGAEVTLCATHDAPHESTLIDELATQVMGELAAPMPYTEGDPLGDTVTEAIAAWRAVDPAHQVEVMACLEEDRTPAHAKEAAVQLLSVLAVAEAPLDLETWRRVTTPTAANPVPCCVCGAPSAPHYTADDIDASCALHPAPPHPKPHAGDWQLGYVLARVERIADDLFRPGRDPIGACDIYSRALRGLRAEAQAAYEKEVAK